MNHIQEILRLMTLYSLQSSIFAGNSFVFNPKTLQHYDQESTVEATVKSGPFAAACPADNSKEREFNTNRSLGDKALFVTGDSGTDYEYMSNKNCDENYELTVVYHSSKGTKTIEFGYEIYEAKYKVARFLGKLFTPSHPKIRSSEEIRYVSFLEEVVENVYRKMSFVWIPKIITKYDTSSWSVEKVSYRMHQKTDQMLVTCKNHNLGKEMYSKSLNTFYTPENQKIIFQTFQISSSLLSACKPTLECVEKYNLISPAYYFQASPEGEVSCSNLTTIPVWSNTTMSLLQYLDKFLVAITEIWDFYDSRSQLDENFIRDPEKRLRVISGVQGILNLPMKKSKKLKPIYLHHKKKIPVPEIIYKIIRYISYQCEPQEKLCLFDILIVIHNYPEFNPEKKLCQEDKCADWGWESIQYAGKSKKNGKIPSIYCCLLDGELKKKLMFFGKVEYITMKSGDLNLKRFPFYNKKTLDYDNVDKHKDIENIARKLLNPKKEDGQNSVPTVSALDQPD